MPRSVRTTCGTAGIGKKKKEIFKFQNLDSIDVIIHESIIKSKKKTQPLGKTKLKMSNSQVQEKV